MAIAKPTDMGIARVARTEAYQMNFLSLHRQTKRTK